MLSGGPEHWSNEPARASAVRLAVGARVARMPGRLARRVMIAIALGNVEGEVLAEATMVLAISPPASPPAPEPVPLRQAFPPVRPGPTPLPQSSAERERALGLHARGMEQLERGNVFAARKFF